MAKPQGFARGDLDTSFPLDDKFLELRGRLTPERYYAATGVYFHVAATIWREASRSKSAARICPDADGLIDELVAVGLLDAEKCVTKRAFANTVGRALKARQTDTERKARNRAGMSRGTDADKTVTPPESRDRHGVSSARARSALLGSVGLGSDTEGGPGETDPLDAVEAWLAKRRAGVPAGSAVHTKLAQLVDAHGAPGVIAAMASLPGPLHEGAQYIYGAVKVLRPIPASPRPISEEDAVRAHVADRLARGAVS